MGTTIQSTLNATPPQEGVGATKETFLVNSTFVSGDVLRLTNAGAWAKASASTTATSAWIGVVERSWSDRFRIVYAGKCELPNHGFAIGAALYLTNAGGLSTAAGSVPKLVGVVTSDRHIVVGNRGGEATVPVATMDGAGIVELATNAEGVTGTATDRAMTPASTTAAIDSKVPAASTTQVGKARLATTSEGTTGTADDIAMTPAADKAALDARLIDATEAAKGLSQIATDADVTAGTDNFKYITAAKLANRLAGGVGAVSGRTIVVDASCPTATDVRGTLSKYNAAVPFATISAAITAYASGDLIYVRRGTYSGTYTLPSNFFMVADPGTAFNWTSTASNQRLFNYTGASAPNIYLGLIGTTITWTSGSGSHSGHMILNINPSGSVSGQVVARFGDIVGAASSGSDVNEVTLVNGGNFTGVYVVEFNTLTPTATKNTFCRLVSVVQAGQLFIQGVRAVASANPSNFAASSRTVIEVTSLEWSSADSNPFGMGSSGTTIWRNTRFIRTAATSNQLSSGGIGTVILDNCSFSDTNGSNTGMFRIAGSATWVIRNTVFQCGGSTCVFNYVSGSPSWRIYSAFTNKVFFNGGQTNLITNALLVEDSDVIAL